MATWVDGTFHAEQIQEGVFVGWVTWHDEGRDRRVTCRLMLEHEVRCDERGDDAVCLLAQGHEGAHVAIAPPLEAMPMIIAP